MKLVSSSNGPNRPLNQLWKDKRSKRTTKVHLVICLKIRHLVLADLCSIWLVLAALKSKHSRIHKKLPEPFTAAFLLDRKTAKNQSICVRTIGSHCLEPPPPPFSRHLDPPAQCYIWRPQDRYRHPCYFLHSNELYNNRCNWGALESHWETIEIHVRYSNPTSCIIKLNCWS